MASMVSGVFFRSADEVRDESHSYDYDYGMHSGRSEYGGNYMSSGDGHSGSYSGHSFHSGYGEVEGCCPLVVDILCLTAILGAIGGAAVLLARLIQVELCRLADGTIVNAPCNRRRRKRSRGLLHSLLLGKLEVSYSALLCSGNLANKTVIWYESGSLDVSVFSAPISCCFERPLCVKAHFNAR